MVWPLKPRWKVIFDIALTLFADGCEGIFIFDFSDYDATASINQISVSAVPEPASVAILAGFGIAGCLLRKWKRS